MRLFLKRQCDRTLGALLGTPPHWHNVRRTYLVHGTKLWTWSTKLWTLSTELWTLSTELWTLEHQALDF